MEKTQSKTYIYDKLSVFFKHTDYYGFIHPYNFYEWTSYVREAFFSQHCGDFFNILNSPIKMMTSKISAEMYDDSIFGDNIEARLTTARIKKISFDVIVNYYNKRLYKIVCKTQHTLVFVDSESQRFASIPVEIRESAAQYESNML